MQSITIITEQGQSPEIDYPKPERLLEGNPRRQTWSGYDSPDGVLAAGIWCCETGAWRIAFSPEKEEFFCVMSGRVRLSNMMGEHWEVGPSEAAVIPAGFNGVFQVLEPVRKYYVIVERKTD
ncbi:cupin domain-containing protein [Vogesella oryzae]|uniref:cupin domain-containing protein n=1 Tax=Vogesella oryzae TaxID=1735285 RepID=UPI001583022F|nr:cupin domain-containing protein [Vogesella oryzae]